MGIGEKPSVFWITSSPWKLRSTAAEIELLIPAAKMVTKVTRARPIISAAAVAAVRAGLRCEFSRASRPTSPRSRSIGHPPRRPAACTRRGLNSETPNSTAAAPTPSSSAALPESSMFANRPISTIATPTTARAPAKTA